MGLIPRLAEDRCSGLPSRIESQVLAQKALIRDRIVGKPAVGTESWEVICQKAFSRTRLGGCPKTLPHGLPQIADSIAVRFPGFAAHKHLSLLKNQTEGRKQFCSGILPQRFYVFISSEV